MPSAESIQPDGRSISLFIGRSGSGKSAAAYSYPHPIKVLDTDGRIRGGLTSWIERKGIDYTYFPSKPEKGTTFDALNNEFGILQVQCRNRECPYQTLVLDSLTWEAIDLLLDAMPLTHAENKGARMGTMLVSGPDDYRFQSTGVLQTLAFLKSLPIPNIIATAHIVGRYGKRKDSNGKIIDPYGPSELIGEQLALTDKLAETVPSMFDNVYKFSKDDEGKNFRFEAHGELARTTFDKIPHGYQDLTKKPFYEEMLRLAQVSTTQK